MKKKTILLIIDIVVRAAFLLFACYIIILKSKTGDLLYWIGYVMIVFNGITTFFDDVAYKKKK